MSRGQFKFDSPVVDNKDVDQTDDDPWIIPLHGIEAPADVIPFPKQAIAPEPAIEHLYDDDDELPTIEFRPRLRRSA